MAHLWSQSIAGEWHAYRLDANIVALSAIEPRVRAWSSDGPGGDPSVVLVSRPVNGTGDAWALLAPAETPLLVNGRDVDHGIVALADRDEIRWPSAAPLFFSTEEPAAVAPFPSDGTRGSCPRCKRPIAAGAAAVRCPGCAIWHHASEALPCWTYAETCAVCTQPTAVDAGFLWTPEEI